MFLGCGAHFKSESAPKCLEIDQDNLHVKFLPLNVDFSSPMSRPSAFKEACRCACQKGVPPKSGHFSAIGLYIMQTVPDRHRCVAYNNH